MEELFYAGLAVVCFLIVPIVFRAQIKSAWKKRNALRKFDALLMIQYELSKIDNNNFTFIIIDQFTGNIDYGSPDGGHFRKRRSTRRERRRVDAPFVVHIRAVQDGRIAIATVFIGSGMPVVHAKLVKGSTLPAHGVNYHQIKRSEDAIVERVEKILKFAP
jgi:hypothetical protein